MKRKQLAKDLARELKISTEKADELLETVVLVMGRRLARGDSICFSNFGTLRPLRRHVRSFDAQARPASAKPDIVQVRFRPADKLLEAVREGDDQVTFQKLPNRLPVG